MISFKRKGVKVLWRSHELTSGLSWKVSQTGGNSNWPWTGAYQNRVSRALEEQTPDDVASEYAAKIGLSKSAYLVRVISLLNQIHNNDHRPNNNENGAVIAQRTYGIGKSVLKKIINALISGGSEEIHEILIFALTEPDDITQAVKVDFKGTRHLRSHGYMVVGKQNSILSDFIKKLDEFIKKDNKEPLYLSPSEEKIKNNHSPLVDSADKPLDESGLTKLAA